MKDIYIIMNRQNILKYYGSKLDLKLDSSELYDYQLTTNEVDYDVDVLINTPIIYDALKIDGSLEDLDCTKTRITLIEDNINDLLTPYPYSGLSMTLPYNDFVSYFGTGYTYTILDGNRFKFTLLNNEDHYFKIYGYNSTGFTSTILSGYTESELISGFTSNVYVDRRNIVNIFACSSQAPKTNVKPWAFNFNQGLGTDKCSPILKRRTEKGWSLDFIFNRDNLSWSNGGIFYYIGVRGDNDIADYSDNNLSFGFTSDGRIKWKSKHYSGTCLNDTSYNESFYTSSGQTETLCTTGLTKDFNITIVFDRYKHYTDCDIENMGGQNDLIIGPHPTDYIINTGVTAVTSTQVVTGYLITNSLDVLTGATPVYQYNEELNKKWADERDRRLGTLKIYLNGNLIYKLKDWEEIIPSKRGEQPFIQSWGGGTGLMGGIHEGVCCFNIKSIKYYEEPLDFVHVKHNFKTRLTDFDFEICNAPCVDDVHGLGYSSPTPTPTPTPTPLPATSTPTPQPTSTPTETPSEFTTGPFNFNFDYMVVEYFFTDGTDMDTQTYISNPSVMSFSDQQDQGYVGTCAQSDFRVYFPDSSNPILTYGNDNRDSQGTEAVLFDLTQFKTQYPSNINLELTFTSTWFSDVGTQPVIMRATLWKKDGVTLPVQDGYTFIYPNAVETRTVQSNGKTIISNTQNCEPFEEVSKFQFNTSTYNGQFI